MIQIITDSTCDLDEADIRELGIHTVPLYLHFNGETYMDGISMSKGEFYEKLACAQQLPTTSQPSPADILDAVSPYLEKGDDVIGIFLSSKLSGTFQSAVIAADMAQSDHFYLVDSLNATFGIALLIRIAARYRDEGKSAAEITAALEELKNRVRLIAVVDTLKYLQMGGRISAATAMMGNLLGINPLIGIIDGSVESIGKARGKKSAYRHLQMLYQQDPPDFSYPVYFGHSNAPEALKELQNVILSSFETPAEIYSAEIGSVIGTHAGPGAVGFTYIAQ